jgi:hypothetical protein
MVVYAADIVQRASLLERACVSDDKGIFALFSFSFLNLVLYQLSCLFIGLVSVEAFVLKGRKRKNWSYRESSSALTIKEFLCKLYTSDSFGCASETSTYESYRRTI